MTIKLLTLKGSDKPDKKYMATFLISTEGGIKIKKNYTFWFKGNEGFYLDKR